MILDDQNLVVSRLMAGEGPDITRALALAWGVRSSALRVHVFVGASSMDDDGEVTSLEAITAAELISEGDDLPQDDDEIEVVEPVEEMFPTRLRKQRSNSNNQLRPARRRVMRPPVGRFLL